MQQSREDDREKKKLCAIRKKQVKLNAYDVNITFVMTYDCNFRCPYCF